MKKLLPPQVIAGQITICGGTGPGCKAGVGCSDTSKCFTFDNRDGTWKEFPEMKKARRYKVTSFSYYIFQRIPFIYFV